MIFSKSTTLPRPQMPDTMPQSSGLPPPRGVQAVTTNRVFEFDARQDRPRATQHGRYAHEVHTD